MKRTAAVVLAIVAASCSPASEPATTAADSTPPDATTVPATTTTSAASSVSQTYAEDYPEVPISIRGLSSDDVSFSLATRSAQPESADIPEFIYGNDFSPSNLHLYPPRPVEITNGTEDDIVVMFSDGVLADLPISAGATESVNFSALPEEIYRFHVFRGNAKIPAFVDTRPQRTTVVPSGQDTTVRQAPFSGSFSIEAPQGTEWYFNPQYDAIVGVPQGDVWLQGDFQWSLATGAALRSSGLRIRTIDAAAARGVLEEPRVPSNCGPASRIVVERSSIPGEELVYKCDGTMLHLGRLDADGVTFIYALADSPANPGGPLHDALETIQLHTHDDAVALTEIGGPANIEYVFPSYVPEVGNIQNLRGTLPVEIDSGAVTGGLATMLDPLSTTVFTFRNFDDLPYVVTVNGGTIAHLPPQSALTVDVLAFELDSVHVTIASPPFVGYSQSVDLTRREPGPPVDMYASTADVPLERMSLNVDTFLTTQGVEAIVLDVPILWADVSEPLSGAYGFWRDASEDDPAKVLFRPAVFRDLQDYLDDITHEARLLPEEITQLVIRFETWTIYRWAPEGNPTTTVAFMAGDGFGRYARLTSSPEDHDHLYESVLVPLIRGFEFKSG